MYYYNEQRGWALNWMRMMARSTHRIWLPLVEVIGARKLSVALTRSYNLWLLPLFWFRKFLHKPKISGRLTSLCELPLSRWFASIMATLPMDEPHRRFVAVATVFWLPNHRSFVYKWHNKGSIHHFHSNAGGHHQNHRQRRHPRFKIKSRCNAGFTYTVIALVNILYLDCRKRVELLKLAPCLHCINQS